MRWALGCCAIVCYMNVIGVIVRATVTNVFCTATLYRGHYCQGPCFCGMVGGHRLNFDLQRFFTVVTWHWKALLYDIKFVSCACVEAWNFGSRRF